MESILYGSVCTIQFGLYHMDHKVWTLKDTNKKIFRRMRLAAATSLETPKLNLGEKFLKMCSDQALNSTSSETNSDSDITNRSSAILETSSVSAAGGGGGVGGLTNGHQAASTVGSVQPNIEQMRNIQILINSLRLNQQTSGLGQSNIQNLLMPNYQSSSVSFLSLKPHIGIILKDSPTVQSFTNK